MQIVNNPGLSGSQATVVNAIPYAGAGDWKTILDLDLTAQGTQSFTTDTTFTFGGLTWTKKNSANEAVHASIGVGGLNFQPASTSDYSGGVLGSTMTFPFLSTPLSGLAFPRTLQWSDKLRFWLYNSANNAAAAFDEAIMSITSGTGAGSGGFGGEYGWVAFRGSDANVSTDGNVFLRGFANNVRVDFGPVGAIRAALPLTAATNVVQLECALSPIPFPSAVIRYGQFAAGFPTPQAMVPQGMLVAVNVSNAFETDNSVYLGTATTPGSMIIRLGAMRAGSLTALSVTYQRFRVDWLPG